MLYLVIHNVTVMPGKYYMMSNITTTESVHNILLSLFFHKFLDFQSQV